MAPALLARVLCLLVAALLTAEVHVGLARRVVTSSRVPLEASESEDAALGEDAAVDAAAPPASAPAADGAAPSLRKLCEAVRRLGLELCQRRRSALGSMATSAASAFGFGRGGESCYYEVLGLAQGKCDASAIKAAYEKLAIEMHPDRASVNGFLEQDAAWRLREIHKAYSLLSDAQERAWYDAHREQVVRGHEAVSEPLKTKINLYKYYGPNCYDGFEDDAFGFFATYADLFLAIDAEEREWEDNEDSLEYHRLPAFGDSKTDWEDIFLFYKRWLDFHSRKGFSYVNKLDPSEVQGRQERRQLQQDNKKDRQAARKQYSSEVQHLVKFVQRRDPRVVAHKEQQLSEKKAREAEEAAAEEQREAEEIRLWQERREAQQREDEERWREVEEARRARGEIMSDNEASEDQGKVRHFRCEACKKSFKSEGNYEQHTKNKKHQEVVKKMEQKKKSGPPQRKK